MRVEVRIKYNNGVGSRQVDANTTRSRTQDVDENVRTWLIEFVHPFLTIDLLRITILAARSARNANYAQDEHTRRRYLILSPTRKSSMTFSAMANYTHSVTL